MSAVPAAAPIPPPNVVPPEDFSVYEIARARLEEMDAPDLDALVNLVAEDIYAQGWRAIDAALRATLRPYLRSTVTKKARRNLDRSTPGSASDRWDNVATQHGNGALAIYRWWINFDGRDPKFFGDCTQQDVQEIVGAYKRRAIEMADQSQRFAAVLRLMREQKAETVQEIPVQRLLEIFHA